MTNVEMGESWQIPGEELTICIANQSKVCMTQLLLRLISRIGPYISSFLRFFILVKMFLYVC